MASEKHLHEIIPEPVSYLSLNTHGKESFDLPITLLLKIILSI